VAAEGDVNLVATRIHAIVLTRDRPETLRRCVATALASLGPEDMLTILDDSVPTLSPVNAALLAINLSASSPTRVYLSTLRAQELLTRAVSRPDLIWLSRTATRDIAPLRNLSLLLSAAVPAEITIFIDDDIYGFDLIVTYHRISALVQATQGVIAGADIDGINERDTITRLTDALCVLNDHPPSIESESSRTLFYVRGSCTPSIESSSRYVSAGYLAFRLPREHMFAFPPGYNEDWLWCLLHGGNSQVSILRSGERVIHDPPSVRRPTRADVLFELLGDFVFECLEELQTGNYLDPQSVLTELSGWLPSPALMPSTRALKLIDKAQSLSKSGVSLHVLEEYGLAALADMLLRRELCIDGSRVLIDWCDDAITKHRSFAAALRGNNVIPALKTLLREGNI
jgi:hypothetical protein